MFLEKKVGSLGDTDLILKEMIKDSGKEDLDLQAISVFITGKARSDRERLVLERIVSNPELLLSLQREYYLHTPDEVKTTNGFIEWIKAWKKRRGNL